MSLSDSVGLLLLCDHVICSVFFFFFSSRRRHTRSDRDWSSDVCSSDLTNAGLRYSIRPDGTDPNNNTPNIVSKVDPPSGTTIPIDRTVILYVQNFTNGTPAASPTQNPRPTNTPAPRPTPTNTPVPRPTPTNTPVPKPTPTNTPPIPTITVDPGP